MNAVELILLVVAFVCFALAAFGVGGKVNLIAVGLAAWVLTVILDSPVLK